MSTRSIFLQGNKLFLSTATREDFGDTMVNWINDKEVTQYLSRGTLPTNGAALMQEFETARDQQKDLQFAIIDNQSGTYIGIVGLHTINWLSRHAEFRILIGEKSFWGKAYGAEACQLIVSYGFEALNLNKIWLGVNTANSRAFESYKRCGFQAEGLLRQELYRNNKYYDIARMSMLHDEYQNFKKEWSVYECIKKTFSA